MILFDFSALKSGGGVQLASNFISYLKENYDLSKIFFLLPDSGPLSRGIIHEELPNVLFSPSAVVWKRIRFELFQLPRLVKKMGVSKVYSFFGAGLPRIKGVAQVTAVAYPIICYPDSPFWGFLPFRKKVQQRIKNYFRVRRLRTATTILCETDVMSARLEKTLRIDSKQFVILPPYPSDYLPSFEPIRNNRILVLSGNGFHKNLWRIPDLIKELSKKLKDFTIVVSVEEAVFRSMVEPNSEVWNHLECTGGVPPEKIAVLYESCAFLLSLSDLESFSNNYMEAWKASRALIVSKRDFAEHICKDSAWYLDPHDSVESAEVIYKALTSSIAEFDAKLDAGKALLSQLPSSLTRFNIIMETIEEA